MVCDIILRRLLGLREKETVPNPNELQEMVGAKDHEEFHAIIQTMSREEIEELKRKIAKWRKKRGLPDLDYLETAPIS